MSMDNKKSNITSYLRYSVIGIELAFSVIAGALIGYWLDAKLDTAPWFFIFWVICGIIAGFRSLFRLVKKIMKEDHLKNGH